MLEWLKTILGDGYTEDIDKKVSEEIGKGFVSKSDFNAKNDAYKALEKQLSERDAQLEELKKVDAGALQSRISQLQADNEAAKADHQKEIADLKFGYTLDAALAGAKVRDAVAVKAHLDTGSLKLSEDGKITGLDEQLTKLKETNDFLFESDKPAPYFSGSTPGAALSGMEAVFAAAGVPQGDKK